MFRAFIGIDLYTTDKMKSWYLMMRTYEVRLQIRARKNFVVCVIIYNEQSLKGTNFIKYGEYPLAERE